MPSLRGLYYAIYPDTTIPGVAAVAMTPFKAEGNSIALEVTTTTGGCVSLTFTAERTIDGSTYGAVIDRDSAWSMVVTTPHVAGTYIVPLDGLATSPADMIRLSYQANTQAGKLKVNALSWDNPRGGNTVEADVSADMGSIEALLTTLASTVTVPTTSVREETINPDYEAYLPVTILFSDEAVVLDPGASYAPDAAGHALTYGHQAAIQIYLRGGTGGGPVDRTVTVTIEGSMGLLIAAAVRWVDVSKSVLDLNTGLSNVAEWTSTGVTATEYLLSLGSVPFSHFRVKYDWSGDPDNTDGVIVINAFKSAL